MQNIIHAGKISTSAIDDIVQDVVQDIDRRVNHGGRDDKPTFFQDEDDEIDEEEENVYMLCNKWWALGEVVGVKRVITQCGSQQLDAWLGVSRFSTSGIARVTYA